MAANENINILALAIAEKGRRIAKSVRRKSLGRNLFGRAAPERLLLAPQDLRPGDPLSALDLNASRFFLAGRMVDCSDQGPFSQTSTPISWQKELHTFQWMRHFDPAYGLPSGNNAQSLISNWLSAFGKPARNIAWNEEVAARRLITWLCHSVPLIESAAPAFYRNWLKSIGNHINFLKHRAADSEAGISKLVVRIALVYAGLCVSGQTSNLKRWSPLLDRELSKQILEDGGHISRNPAVIPEILAMLLPLRESFNRLGVNPGHNLVSAIDRMMSALKFFQMSDGNIARFNGVSAGRPELVSTLLFHDDAPGPAPATASQSGYQRFEMGPSVLIVDTGNPPHHQVSELAHAGTLSFEFSCGSSLIMVNCGAPQQNDTEYAALAKTTAAHNTLTVNDTSSSRYYAGGRFRRLLGRKLISGPIHTGVERTDTASASMLEAKHDGYANMFGLVHSRMLRLSENGDLLEGLDTLLPVGSGTVKAQDFTIRFHLHPSVSVGKNGNADGLLLMCGSGMVWKFVCGGIKPVIDESVFLASSSGPKRTKQIVLQGNTADVSEVFWKLERQLQL